jgi:16S rRNA processing protein RimM
VVVRRISCGRFSKPFGLKGEIKFIPRPSVYLKPSDLGSAIAAPPGNPEEGFPVDIESAIDRGKYWLLSLAGFSAPEAVSRLTNMELVMDRSQMPPMPEGVYLEEDLIGLAVVEADGRELGAITSVIRTGANDVWEVALKGGGELLLPVVEEVILSVDIENRKVVVKLIEGLMESCG